MEIKKFVMDKFQIAMWSNNMGRKKAHYIEVFNPSRENRDKAYLGAAIKGKPRVLLAQLRTGSNHLRCKTGKWKRPKEEWEERICRFYEKGAIETE